MSKFPAPGDVVQLHVSNGGWGSSDIVERVQQVNPYGVLVEIWRNYHVPERDRDLYGGKEQDIALIDVMFYPWTNVLSVRPAKTPEWMPAFADGEDAA